MIKCLSQTITWIAVFGGVATAHRSPRRSSRVLANVYDPPSDVFACRILLFDVMSVDEEKLPDFYMCNPVKDGQIASERYPIDLPPLIAAKHQSMMNHSSALAIEDFYIGIPYGYIDPVNLEIVIPDPSGVIVLPTDYDRHRNLARKEVSSIGEYTVLVLRIIDKNGIASSHSFDDLRRLTFDAQDVSLHSQYLACSWGQLSFEPAGGIGVLDVVVASDSTVVDKNKLTLEAETVAMKLLGITNLFDYTDFVMFVTPPMGSWVAYASVGGGYSVYNSKWGGLMGATMHEVGHNLGLLHSNQGDLGASAARYQDFSGYMGGAKGSFLREGYPVQCFNAANHWELGWYDPTHALEVVPSTPQKVYIGAFADRDLFSNLPGLQEYAIVKSGDYYIQYNGAWGINKDTNEAANHLLVTQQWDDGSYLVGQILNNPGAEWTLPGSSWTIKICDKAPGSDVFAEVLTVWMGNGTPDCSLSDNTPAGNGDVNVPSDEAVCKDSTETCTNDEDCCSKNCRPNGRRRVCLPNPDSNDPKDQFRISRISYLRTARQQP